MCIVGFSDFVIATLQRVSCKSVTTFIKSVTTFITVNRLTKAVTKRTFIVQFII